MTRTKLLIGVLLLVLAFYLSGLLLRSWAVVQDGGVYGWLLALGMVVLVVLAVGAVTAELRFGWATERLGRTLDAEGGLPEVGERAADGRLDRAAADEAAARCRAEVEAEPASWRPWFRLALAYEAAGDRKRARAAARHAVRLRRDEVDRPGA